jgi:CTP:molybdopterin cytidylyltransferase MocA
MAIPLGIQVVRAAQARQGMGSSLAAGIQSLANTQATAMAVLLGDMPWISVATLRQLRAKATLNISSSLTAMASADTPFCSAPLLAGIDATARREWGQGLDRHPCAAGDCSDAY